jgi:Asp-tRNA(Asn)/Glu-tRNA(Gln) amidotransferase A subunit family amidase
MNAKLTSTTEKLSQDTLDLPGYLDALCDRIDAAEPVLHALVPEPNRCERLHAAAAALQARFPDPASRPPLWGVPVGVKDIFRVDGFPTHAGSQLPPEALAGPETACVSTLRAAGALVLGKTVTAEFAFFEPGPTRNPHNPEHTPGGSSSGSAAAVAAGYCPLALGTQTIGSTIRPAAYCGIVGFKPSYDRIPADGLIFCAPSFDHVGLFTPDVAGMTLAASLMCRNWRPAAPAALPVLGVPRGPYLEQATPEGLSAFASQLERLQQAGYIVKHIPALEDIAAITHHHLRLMKGEMAQTHHLWFSRYAALYRPATAEAIREGQTVPESEMEAARAGQLALRAEIESLMDRHAVDLWVTPAATGPAPAGIASTGSSVMSLPWTNAGMPAISLPAGRAANGLPLGLQCVGRFMADEQLLAWAAPLSEVLRH